MEHTFQPARPKWVLAFGALAIAFVVGFTTVLSASLQLVTETGRAVYEDYYQEDFVYSVSAEQEGERLIITGYGYMDGVRIDTVDCVVALQSQTTAQTFLLPTQMVQDETINAEAEDGIDYSYAGFYATVYLWQLDQPLSDYKVFISYRNNDRNGLYDTFRVLENIL